MAELPSFDVEPDGQTAPVQQEKQPGCQVEDRFGFTCELHSTSAAQSDFSGRFSLSLFFSPQKTRSGLK